MESFMFCLKWYSVVVAGVIAFITILMGLCKGFEGEGVLDSSWKYPDFGQIVTIGLVWPFLVVALFGILLEKSFWFIGAMARFISRRKNEG